MSDKRQISIPNLFFSIDSAARCRAGSDLRVRSVKLFHLQWRGFFVHVFRFLSVDGGTRALAEGRRIIAAVIIVVWCSIPGLYGISHPTFISEHIPYSTCHRLG